MATALLVAAVSLALDNIRVAAVLGLMEPAAEVRLRIALSFAAAEGLAVLVGAFVGDLSGEFIGMLAWIPGTALLGALGALALVGALRGRTPGVSPTGARFGIGLPILLSADNAIGGAGLGLAGAPVLPAALTVAVVSGMLSFAALELAARLGGRLPVQAELVGALGLLGAASLIVLAH
jgi:putative Mn2+ efflux pump MntP